MWLTLMMASAHAQSPGLSFGPRGELRWLVEDVQAERFPDSTGRGPSLATGDEVEIILTDGDRVRIKKGTRFGWVAASALTAEAPEVELSDDLINPLLAPPGGGPPNLGAGLSGGGPR